MDNCPCDIVACAANSNRNCTALVDNNFGGKACPFYKTTHDNRTAMKEAMDRLDAIGKPELKNYISYKEDAI